MISLPPVVRVYLYTAPCDMRQGFDRLKALAEAGVGVDPRAVVICSCTAAGGGTGSRSCTGVCHECERKLAELC